ncbi:MAG: hypothetical protein WCK88_00225 [bacterium]
MTKKSSPNKALSIIVAIVLVAIIGFVMSQSSGTNTSPASGDASSNIEVRNGVQYITIDVKGGYSPRTNIAK